MANAPDPIKKPEPPAPNLEGAPEHVKKAYEVFKKLKHWVHDHEATPDGHNVIADVNVQITMGDLRALVAHDPGAGDK